MISVLTHAYHTVISWVATDNREPHGINADCTSTDVPLISDVAIARDVVLLLMVMETKDGPLRHSNVELPRVTFFELNKDRMERVNLLHVGGNV